MIKTAKDEPKSVKVPSRDPVALLSPDEFGQLVKSGKTPVYLVRHGQTDWNREKRLQGREDIPLNAFGKTQSKACGKAFKEAAGHGFKIDKIYSSPLMRSMETAEYISDALGISPPIAYPMLTERDYGELSGLTIQQRRRKFPFPGDENQAAGIESRFHAGVRMKAAICAIAARNPGGAAAVIHGGALGALFYKITAGKVGSGKNLSDNCGISIVAADKNEIVPVAFNLSSDMFLEYAAMVRE